MPSTRAVARRPDTVPKIGVGYSRFSTPKQGSIADQRARNDELAAENGVVLVARFADEGVSRELADRQDLQRLFDYLEEHAEVGFIVVNELERMTAGVGQRDVVARLCKRLRVTILEDQGAIDPFDEQAMHEADQRAVLASGEVLKGRRRTRRSLRQRVLAGTVAMRPAYGTRMKALLAPDGTELPHGARMLDATGKTVRSGVLETHPEELPWLIKIFEWAAEGVSYDAIARRLTEAAVPTKSGAELWRGTTVRGIVKNPLYKGDYEWGKQATLRDADGRKYLEKRQAGDPQRLRLASPLGAVVDTDLWERAQHVGAARSGRTGTRRTYGPQLFDNLV